MSKGNLKTQTEHNGQPRADDDSESYFFPDKTDAGLAEMFLKKSRIKLVYPAEKRTLFQYIKGLWEVVSDKKIIKAIISAAKEWEPIVKKSYADELRIIRYLRSQGGSKAVLEMVKAKTVVSITLFDRRKDLINLLNGVLHLPTLRLLKPSYRFYFTMRANVSYKSKAKPPTLFLRLIFSLVALPLGHHKYGILENLRRVQFIRRLTAISSSGQVREHILPMLVGQGANGKSTLIELLTYIFGSYASQMFIATLSSGKPSHSDLARYKGKRYLSAAETSEDFKLNTATAKSLTGGDTISARHLYQSWFDFTPEATLWLHTNILPNVSDNTHGIWRRIKLIRSYRVIPEKERDADLLKKLKQDADTIFSFMVADYPTYLRQGLRIPKSVENDTQTYERESDPLASVLEIIEIDPEFQNTGANSEYFTYVKQLRNIQNEQAKITGEKVLSSKALVALFMQKGYFKARKSSNGQTDWAIVGIRLKPMLQKSDNNKEAA